METTSERRESGRDLVVRLDLGGLVGLISAGISFVAAVLPYWHG